MKKLLIFTCSFLVSFAAKAEPYFTNVWAEVEAYPSGAGKVYMTSNDVRPAYESGWGERSESRFTIQQDGETYYYNSVGGEFVQTAVPRFFGIVEVNPAEGYDCVGLVKRIDENDAYEEGDYYYGGIANHNKVADLLQGSSTADKSYRKVNYVAPEGAAADVNSGRDGTYTAQSIFSEAELTAGNSKEGDEKYYFYHDIVKERGVWPDKPTKIYALFKEKVKVTLDEKGEAIFSSSDNLKLQDNSDLKAYVVYKIVNGKGKLKETDSIPAHLGVILKGEPGQTYTFDRIPEPKRLTITNSDGVKTYNALLCEIFGFYPESEILYMYGNYEYGEGFYKVNDWYQPSGNYLTVAIAGGTPPAYFTLDATPTGIEDIEDGRLNDENESSAVYDLQGRKLSSSNSQLSTLPKGLYIKDGKKIVKK